MELSFKLNAFEGPLDLLLHLIEKNKINIYDIPIALITEQYLEYVSRMDRQVLEETSEFLVMAATLLDMKAKMLLPKEAEEEGNEEDPRTELVERLLEHKLYREMAGELLEKKEQSEVCFFREPDIPEEVACYQEPVDLQELLSGVTLTKLKQVFDMVMKRSQDKMDPVRSRFGKIQKEPIKVSDKIRQVVGICKKEACFSFRSLLERQSDRLEIVVTFLAVLELLKLGWITLSQEELFGEIQIQPSLPKTDKPVEELALEFT